MVKYGVMNISEIATAAGVSTATVSRVLNNSSKVAPQTARAVLSTIERLGYDRDAQRRGRPVKPEDGLRTRNISLLFPDVNVEAMSTALSGKLAHGVEEALAAHEVNLLLSHLRTSHSLPFNIANGEVDGVILRAGDLSLDLRTRLQTMPVVWAFAPSHALPDRDIVQPDNWRVGQLAHDYLTAQGCQCLAAVNTVPAHVAFRQRLDGFMAASGMHGTTVTRLATSDLHEVAACLPTELDGLFIPGAEAEITVLYRLLEKIGKKPFEQVKLIGCANHDDPLNMLDMRLDNIDIQAVEVGRTAGELILWRLRNPERPARRVLIQPTIKRSQNQL